MTQKKGGFLLLAALMLLLFNAPVISGANKVAFLYQVPVLYIFLFSAWLICIVLLYVISRLRTRDRSKKR